MATEENNCFFLADGKKQGPVTEPEIETLYKQGRIGNNTLFAKPGMKEWLPLSKSGIITPEPDYEDPLPKLSEKCKISRTLYALPLLVNGFLAVILGVVAVIYANNFYVNSFWAHLNDEYLVAVWSARDAANWMAYALAFGGLLVIAGAVMSFMKISKEITVLNKVLWLVPLAMILTISVISYISIFSFATRYA